VLLRICSTVNGLIVKTWVVYLTHASEVLHCRRETRQWLAITLAYLKIRRLHYPYALRLRSGQQITLQEYEDVIVFWLVFARRHYPVDPADRVIVDVGANIGMFTLYAARQAPKSHIVAIEPFPDTCLRLRSHVEANQLQDRVTILNWAVSSSSSSGNMDSAREIPSQYRRIHSETTKTLNFNHRKRLEQDEEGIAVKTETLEKLLDYARVDSGDLVKINIHGSEYEVLLSATPVVLRRCKKIALQYHEMPARLRLGKQDLFKHLSGNGFELVFDHDTQRGSGLAFFARAT
jgi:FkbM family methyltransferase